MTEYIERDAAIKIAEKYGTCNGSVLGRHSGIADIIASRIDAIPAADVVPVVRCRDCEHSYDDIGGRICAYGSCVDCVVEDDFYCKKREAE